jgi:hypothetical protein
LGYCSVETVDAIVIDLMLFSMKVPKGSGKAPVFGLREINNYEIEQRFR